MDVETSEAIERINDNVAELRTELHEGLTGVRSEAVQSRGEVRNEFASVRTEIGQLRTELRAEIREGLAEAKRHAQILHEDLKDDIRIVAEGVAHLSARRDSGPQ